jgi:hypothetical protein
MQADLERKRLHRDNENYEMSSRIYIISKNKRQSIRLPFSFLSLKRVNSSKIVNTNDITKQLIGIK